MSDLPNRLCKYRQAFFDSTTTPAIAPFALPRAGGRWQGSRQQRRGGLQRGAHAEDLGYRPPSSLVFKRSGIRSSSLDLPLTRSPARKLSTHSSSASPCVLTVPVLPGPKRHSRGSLTSSRDERDLQISSFIRRHALLLRRSRDHLER